MTGAAVLIIGEAAGKERGAAVLVIEEEQIRRGEQQWELLVIGEEQIRRREQQWEG